MARARSAHPFLVRLSAVVVAAAVGVLGACNKAKSVTPGQLVIAIDTDMALPDQIDTIEIVVVSKGTTLLDYPMPVGTGEDAQPIPATLTLVAGDSSATATIRVLGWRKGVARTLREVTTTIPSDRQATLRMPVQWLCDGTAVPAPDVDGGPPVQSTCAQGETCQAGSCVTSKVDSGNLPTYQAQSIFGGGDAPTGKGTSDGTCFDTIPCLVGGTLEAPDDPCTIAMPAGGAGVNVGLRVANDGICDATGATCFVPLDSNSNEGWTVQAGRIALPTAVCGKLQAGLIAGVVVSTNCPSKTEADPPCGPWSSVTPGGDTGSPPGAPTTEPTAPVLVASLAPDGGTSVACCPLMADGSKLYTCMCDATTATPTPQIVSIDPTTGTPTSVGRPLAPQQPRAQYAAVVAGTDFYWIDRAAGGDAGLSCPVYATSTLDGTTGTPLAVANADVYLDKAVLLADPGSLYALADAVAGLPATAAPVQLLRIARDTGTVTPLDTGGTRPVFQFTQDAQSIYVAVDTDETGSSGPELLSRVVQFAKGSSAATAFAQDTVTNPSQGHGGTIGLQSDGTSLFSLFEAAPDADGSIDTQIRKLPSPGATPVVVYDVKLAPSISQLRLLGAAQGVLLAVRTDTPMGDGGASELESTVFVFPATGGAPRIVASFLGDAPIFEIQAPTFTSDVFWLNQSGRIFRLPAEALR